MAYAKNYDTDVFVSYNGPDDDTIGTDKVKWVESFKNHLEAKLRQILRGDIDLLKVFYAPKEVRGFSTAADLSDIAKNSAIFVAITGTQFQRSPLCMGEMRSFCVAAGQDVNQRTFRVVRRPVPSDCIPAEIRPVKTTEFFHKVDKDHYRSLRPLDEGYDSAMEDLANLIARALEPLHERPAAPYASDFEGRAYVGSGIVGPLKARVAKVFDNCKIKKLPDEQCRNRWLNGDVSTVEHEIFEQLEQAHISVHIIEQAPKPIVRSELEQLSECSGEHFILLKSDEPNVREKVEKVKSSGAYVLGAGTTVTEFINIITASRTVWYWQRYNQVSPSKIRSQPQNITWIYDQCDTAIAELLFSSFVGTKPSGCDEVRICYDKASNEKTCANRLQENARQSKVIIIIAKDGTADFVAWVCDIIRQENEERERVQYTNLPMLRVILLDFPPQIFGSLTKVPNWLTSRLLDDQADNDVISRQIVEDLF